MEFKEFSSDGKLVFSFDQQMFVPKEFQNYTLEAVGVEPEIEKRLLDNSSTNSTDKSAYLMKFIEFKL